MKNEPDPPLSKRLKLSMDLRSLAASSRTDIRLML